MEGINKLALKLLLLFVSAQFLGIYTGSVILNDISSNPYIQPLVVNSQPEDAASAFYFFAYILASAIALLLLMKFVKLELVFRVLEFFMISASSSIVFYALLRFFFAYGDAMALGIVGGAGLAISKLFYPRLKNFATIAATAGVGTIFGISFGVMPAIIFLVLLAFYDYIAVFITKHMVGMADFLIKKDLAFTVTAKELMPSIRGEKPKERRIDLGSGDMVAPIMFEVSLLSYSTEASVFVFLGALISFTIFLVLVFTRRSVLPALPPLVLGMISFFVLGLLLGVY